MRRNRRIREKRVEGPREEVALESSEGDGSEREEDVGVVGRIRGVWFRDYRGIRRTLSSFFPFLGGEGMCLGIVGVKLASYIFPEFEMAVSGVVDVLEVELWHTGRASRWCRRVLAGVLSLCYNCNLQTTSFALSPHFTYPSIYIARYHRQWFAAASLAGPPGSDYSMFAPGVPIDMVLSDV